MSFFSDTLAGLISSGKKTLGLQDVNLFPGDVNKNLTGISASNYYGIPATYPTVGGSGTTSNGRYYSNPTTSTGGSIADLQKKTGGGQVLGASTQSTPVSGNSDNSGGNNNNNSNNSQNDYIDQLYSSGMGMLSGAENSLNQQFSEQSGLVDQANALLQKQIENQYQQEVDQQNSNRQEIGDTYLSAIAQARRDYSALNQRAKARFGGGSSAGQASQELAQAEYWRQFGGNTSQYMKEVANIGKQLGYIKNGFDESLKQLDLNKGQQLADLRAQLGQGLQAIQRDRFTLETNKTQMKQDLLKQMSDRWQNTQNYFQQLADSLKVQAATLAAEKTGQFNQLMQLGNEYQQKALGGFEPYQNNQLLGANYTTPASYQAALKKATNPEDELQGLVNPFLS